jgi:hypothetical protein
LDEETEVVASGGQSGVHGVALTEIVTPHAVLGLDVADDGSTAGTPAHLAFDLRGDPPPLTRDNALNL